MSGPLRPPGGHALTLAQRERIQLACEELLFNRLLSSQQIERVLGEQYRISRRSVRNYIGKVYKAHAKASAAAPTRIDRDRVTEALIDTYNAARDHVDKDGKPAPDFGSAIRALDRLARLRGLYVERVEVSGPGGAPLSVSVEDAREELLRRIDRVAAAGEAAGSGPEPTASGGEGDPR